METTQRIVTLDVKKVRKFLNREEKVAEVMTKTITTRLNGEDLHHLEKIRSITGLKTKSEALRWGFRKGYETLEKEKQ